MAQTRGEGLKQYLLLGFVALTVAMVPLIWADNLNDSYTGFVRGTPVQGLATALPVASETAPPTLAPPTTSPTTTPMTAATASATPTEEMPTDDEEG